MDYKEVTFENAEKYLKDYRSLGDYGWGFAVKDADLIKQIAKEDGWKVFKITNPDSNKTNGYHRDYYFVSDKYKCFVPVSKQFWEDNGFQRYLNRAIGKLHN